MITVPCPWCGPRNSADLRYVGESRPRPDPNAASPAEWRAYLYERRNPARLDHRDLVLPDGLPALFRGRAPLGDQRDQRLPVRPARQVELEAGR